MKKLITLIAILITAGCATTDKVTLTTKTVPVAVPLVYSPAPVLVSRPDLPHLTITPTDEKVDGKVVEAYAASIQALLDYSKELEKELQNYTDINQAYSSLRAKLIADWKTSTGIDITIPDPTIPKTTP